MSERYTSRRDVLATLGVAGTGCFAGCNGLLDNDSRGDDDRTNGESDSTPTNESVGEDHESTGQALTITDFSLDPVSARQTDTVTLTLTVTNEGTDVANPTLVFRTDNSRFYSESGAISPDEGVTVTAQRELLHTGEHRFQAMITQNGSPVTTADTSVEVGQYPSSFVDVDGTDFTLDDGTFYISGGDASSSLTIGITHPHHDRLRPLMFDGLERIGATAYRLFPEQGTPVEDGGAFPGEDNERFFNRFDRTLMAAKRRNMRVSIPIISGRPWYDKDPEEHFGNHVPAYVYRADTADEIDDFYRNEECIELYKQWVEEFLTHENHLTGVEYRHDPTIFMWELGNEVQWTEPWTRDDPTIRPWIEEVGPYVKELAGDQLLTTGIAGYSNSRNNFVEDHRPDCVDACSLHYYPGPGGYDLSEAEREAVLDQKIRDAHETLEKPLWLSEYSWGYRDIRNTPEELPESFLEERNREYRKWHDRLDEADVAGVLVHQVNTKKALELVDQSRGHTTIYPFEDTGTAEELRRYARIAREKSTASSIPELTNTEEPTEQG